MYRNRVPKPHTIPTLSTSGAARDRDHDIRTFRARYAAQLLRNKVEQHYWEYKQRQQGPGHGISVDEDIRIDQREELPPFTIPRSPPDARDGGSLFSSDARATQRICIVGAGCAGLYLAMLLTHLGFKHVDVYEAAERVGGRVYTYTFPKEKPDGTPIPKAQHNYYDIGAMRFPCIPPMQPTFDLFDFLNVPLKDYWMERPKYRTKDETQYLPPPSYINLRYDTDTSLAAMEKSFEFILQEIYNNFHNGFELLMKYDFQSSREYFRNYLEKQNLPTEEIFRTIQNWETFDTSTGLFDQAFSETVLDYVDFNQPPDTSRFPSGWARVEGGTKVLIEAMQNWISSHQNGSSVNIKVSHRVTSLERTSDDRMRVTGTIRSQHGDSCTTIDRFEDTYHAVFNTTTMGALQKIDLKGLPNINEPDAIKRDIAMTQWQAIRSLHYDVSVKVAIKFTEAWWITRCGLDPKSGTSSTDLPIRTVVWSSWNNPPGISVDDNDDPHKPTVIIASYTWAQDASRMASSSKTTSPLGEQDLIVLVLENLVKLFEENERWKPTYEELRNMYLDHHSYDWNKDPYAANAFALFGPGQFTNLYRACREPIMGSNNRLFVCGEAVSAHHAWISGALDSATAALVTYCVAHPELNICATEILNSKLGNGSQAAFDLPDELMKEEHVLRAIVEFGKDKPTFEY